MKKKTKMKN